MKSRLWIGLCLLLLLHLAATVESGKKKKAEKEKKEVRAANSKKTEAKQLANKSKPNRKTDKDSKSKNQKPSKALQKSAKKTAKVKNVSKSGSNSSDSSSKSSTTSSTSSSSLDRNQSPIEIATEQESLTPSLWNASVGRVNELMGYPSVITKCFRKGDLALTFDDGLSQVTSEVIDMLKRENVTATFFIIGQTLELNLIGNRKPKEVLESMLRSGHEFASHTYSHPNLDEHWPEGIEYEMRKTGDLFENLTGHRPRFMRPPFGNASERTIKALHSLGYFIVNWNADTNDWLHKNAPDRALLEFTTKVPSLAHVKMIELQKGPNQKAALFDTLDSKIVLMHDILPRIVEYGPQIIAHARALGYNFVSMSECLGGVNPYFS